jgi:bifunctional non-homologous end joining protein LigD
VTKGDLLDYYEKIAPKLLPHLRDRPMTLERLPEGLAGKKAPHFWQKNTPDYYPKWIPRVTLPTEAGKPVQYVLVNDVDTLLYLVNQGTITFHPFLSRVESLDEPDYVLFDIDPHQSTFGNAVKVARALHDVLENQKVESFVKTTGKSGLHVLTPWKQKGGYGEARQWAAKIAGEVVEALPKVATTERSIGKRGGKVYIDVMQNARGHHAVPPYVVRDTPGATVSMPVEWKAFTGKLDPGKFTVKTAGKLLKGERDLMGELVSE